MRYRRVRVLVPEVITIEDNSPPKDPQVGSFSGLMAKMEGKIKGGKIGHQAMDELGK